MAILGGRYGDGAGGSAAKSALATVAAVGGTDLVQVIIKADDDNTGSIFVGGSTLTSGGVGSHMRLTKGQAETLGNNIPFAADLTHVYVIGSDANQIAYVSVVTGGSRSTISR
jgi:hypothetical protein